MLRFSTNIRHTFGIIWACFFLGTAVHAQSSHQCRLIRKAICDTAFDQVGNTENTNRNDGLKINKYALSQGGKTGDAYCSWGILYCYRQNKVIVKTNGRAISWSIPKEAILIYKGKILKNIPIRKGDVVISQTGSQNHVEIITNWNQASPYCYTVGFNTWSNFENIKKRQGVWIHQRLKKRLIVCNHLQFFWKTHPTLAVQIAKKMAYKTSEQGKQFIKKEELKKLKAYPDGNGYSIGYGSQYYKNGKKVGKYDTITDAQAESEFEYDIADFDRQLNTLISNNNLSQNQYDSIASFTYNRGIKSFRDSKLRKMINNNPNDPAIYKQFMIEWGSNTKYKTTLINRREREAKNYFIGVPLPNNTPIEEYIPYSKSPIIKGVDNTILIILGVIAVLFAIKKGVFKRIFAK